VVRLYLKNKAKKGCGCGSSGRDEQGSKFNSQYYKKKKKFMGGGARRSSRPAQVKASKGVSQKQARHGGTLLKSQLPGGQRSHI
jgi:hypothetical protein